MFTKRSFAATVICLLVLTAWSGRALGDIIANGGIEDGWDHWRHLVLGGQSTAFTELNTTDPHQGAQAAQLHQERWVAGDLVFFDNWNDLLTVGDSVAAGDTLRLSFAAKAVAADAGAALQYRFAFYNDTKTVSIDAALWASVTPATAEYTSYSFEYIVPEGNPPGSLTRAYLGFRAGRVDGGTTGLADYLIDSISVTQVSAVPGDFDGDGDVDGADFVVWQTNFPKAEGGTLDTGDADGDGDVDGADFVVWQTHFPTTPGPAAAPIPEPAAWMLCCLTVPAFVLVGRRRAKKDLGRRLKINYRRNRPSQPTNSDRLD